MYFNAFLGYVGDWGLATRNLKELGIDKDYTKAFHESDGNVHNIWWGVLTQEYRLLSLTQTTSVFYSFMYFCRILQVSR